MKKGVGMMVVISGLCVLGYAWINKSVWNSEQRRIENTGAQIAMIQASLGTNWKTVNDLMSVKYGSEWTNDLTPSKVDEIYEQRKQLRKHI